jgi:hypothetical protein
LSYHRPVNFTFGIYAADEFKSWSHFNLVYLIGAISLYLNYWSTKLVSVYVDRDQRIGTYAYLTFVLWTFKFCDDVSVTLLSNYLIKVTLG